MGGCHPGTSANFLYMDTHVESHQVPRTSFMVDKLTDIGWWEWK